MAVSEIHFKASSALGKMTSATVIFPEGAPGPFSVLYLLHGMTDDHTAWVRRTSLERYLDGLPLIVVMPNGERGFYIDAKSRPQSAYDNYISRELIGFVDGAFQTVAARRGRAIAGLSMGGYGAFAIALKHPEMFCAASSHSGALSACNRPRWMDAGYRKEFVPLFGPRPKGGPDDLFQLARNVDKVLLPALRFDCGKKDFLLDENRAFHRHLKRLKIKHTYREYPGQHDWAYWDDHIKDTLKFVGREMGI